MGLGDLCNLSFDIPIDDLMVLALDALLDKCTSIPFIGIFAIRVCLNLLLSFAEFAAVVGTTDDNNSTETDTLVDESDINRFEQTLSSDYYRMFRAWLITLTIIFLYFVFYILVMCNCCQFLSSDRNRKLAFVVWFGMLIMAVEDIAELVFITSYDVLEGKPLVGGETTGDVIRSILFVIGIPSALFAVGGALMTYIKLAKNNWQLDAANEKGGKGGVKRQNRVNVASKA